MLNNHVKDKRQSYGMSIAELSRRAGVSRVTIFNIENHKHQPSGYLVLKLAEVLRCEPKELFFVDSDKYYNQSNKV